MPAINQTIYDTFTLRDNSDDPIIGKVIADFAVFEAYALPLGTPTAVPTLYEIGLGEYAYSFIPTTAATWTVHVVYDSGGVFREGSETYDVTLISVGGSGTGTTLGALRRSVADLLGKVVVAEATAAVPAPASTFTSSTDLLDNKDHYAGADLVVASGLNAGHRGRVTGSSLDSQTVSFVPAAPFGFAIGDAIELYGGISQLRVQQIDRAIKDVIRDAFPAFRIRTVVDIPGPYDPWTDPGFEVPEPITHVFAVQSQEWNGSWRDVRPGSMTMEGWRMLPGRRIEIAGGPQAIAADKTLRVLGFIKEPELVLDSDETQINPEYVRLTAATLLRFPSNDPGALQKAGMAGGLATASRPRVAVAVPPNTRKVIP